MVSKEKQREFFEGFPETTGLRIHRVISWIKQRFSSMLSSEIIRVARMALLNRARSLRRIEYSQPVENSYIAGQICGGDASKDVVTCLQEVFGDQNGRPALYSISADCVDTSRKIATEFDALKKKKDLGYRLPKRNGASHAGPTLYVGSSENILRRLGEHLGKAHPGTYALNMQHWCPEFEGKVIVSVQLLSSDTSRECRQDMEDALWNSLQPIFGRLGAR